MIHRDGRFKGARDVSVYYQMWLPTDTVKAAILLVHGLGEHSGRYEKSVVKRMLDQGYAVYSLDHIGHGQSAGKRKHINRFTDFTETLDIYYQQVKALHGDAPIFILGHSLGGLISANYLLKHQNQFDGAILSAPALKVSEGIPPLKVFIGKILARIVPEFGIIPINPTKISRDPNVVQAYMDDNLVHKGNSSARLGAEILLAMQRVEANRHELTLPTLILQGTEDAIINPQGAQEFYDGIASQDKTLKLYDGLYHEAFNEPEKERVFEDLTQWLAAKL